jgi:formate dehydrogenase
MTETKYTFCRICEVLCGLKVTVEENRVTSIVPDRNHFATKGFACPKGINQHHFYDSHDRLKYPMKREGNEWKRISWGTALEEIGAKVATIRKEFHPNAIAMYVGTAAGFGVLHPIFAQGFMTAVGSASMYSSSTQDCSNKFAVAQEMYGFPFTQPFPDLTNINCLIIVGANPVISKWSFLQVPDPAGKLKAITERGGKLYVVDPRKTETAKIAGEHHFIRPGTDLFFYLSFLHEVIRKKGTKRGPVDRFTTGYDELEKLAADWPPAKSEAVTGMPASIVEKMVDDYLDAKGAALYCSTGVNMGTHGTLAFWIQECINAITGNLDKKGGTLVSKGIIDFPKFGSKKGLLLRPNRSRVGNCRSINDAFPGGILADEILTPGKEKVRALFVTGGNPLITMPDSNRLREAFKELDLLVALDILPTETASLAHYALPCTSPLERPDLPFIFPLMLGMQLNPYLQATDKIVEPREEQRDEASIYLDLCRYSNLPFFGSKLAQKFLEKISKKETREGFLLHSVPQRGILSTLLWICGAPGFKRLLKFPHGLPWLAHETDFVAKRLYTKDKKVHLAPEMFMKATAELESQFQSELNNSARFKLITKRAVKTHNSWTHNHEPFVKEPEHTNYLYLHPLDAEEIGVAENDLVDVTSDTGKVRLPLRITEDLLRKTAALPHGWGHQESGLSVARKTRGVNVNILAPSGPANIDPLSGNALLTGIYVEVKKADGEQSTESWSGI